MKTYSFLCAFFFFATTSIFAQGSLTPPGAPAPTMKSLDQVEPRIPVDATHTPGDASSLFKITQAGSYYLTSNLTGVAGKSGIVIAADGVTLDLMGHKLIGVASSLDGIFVSGARPNITIRNGTVRGWGGFGAQVANANGCHCEDLGVTLNTGGGIRISDGVIQRCSAKSNGADGIQVGSVATVLDCTSSGNTGDGFLLAGAGSSCTFVNCVAFFNFGNGLTAGSSSTLINCVATGNAGTGITLSTGGNVQGCVARGNGSTGIGTGDNSLVKDCTSETNNGANSNGFSLGANCTMTGCVASGNLGAAGILTGDNSNLSHCTASANTSSAASSSGIETGNNCALSHCTASANSGSGATSFGIQTGTNASVIDCTASLNTNTNGALTNTTGGGIAVLNRSTVVHCTASQNKGDGVKAPTGCLLKDNTGQANGNGTGDGAGIHTTGSDNRIESNNVAGNDRGIDVDSTGNIIIKNSASGNTTNYVIAASNRYGPIIDITASGAAAVSGNSAVDTTTTTHPWANFAY